MVGNIYNVFQLAITKKAFVEEMMQKNLQKVAELKANSNVYKLPTNKTLLPSNICKLSCKIWKAWKRRFKSWKLKIPTTRMNYEISTNKLPKSVRHWVPSIWNGLNSNRF